MTSGPDVPALPTEGGPGGTGAAEGGPGRTGAAGVGPSGLVGARPAPPAAPPCPQLARLFAPPLAAALATIDEVLDPGWAEGSWVREVRIASRRIRTMLAILRRPGDLEGIRAWRATLRTLQDDLSGSRDREVVLKWLRREDAAWGEVPADHRAAVVAALADEAAAPAIAAGGPTEGAAPAAAVAGASLASLSRPALHAHLSPTLDALRALVRASLPEELAAAWPRHPAPAAAPPGSEPPADTRASPEGDGACTEDEESGGASLPPLPPAKQLYPPRTQRDQRRAAAAALDAVFAEVQRRMPALAEEDPDPERLHDLRRMARRLRYGLEALRKSIPDLKRWRGPVKRFQWLLGQVQDRRVVGEELARLPDHVVGPRAAWAALLADEVAALLAEARGLRDQDLDPARWARARAAWVGGARR